MYIYKHIPVSLDGKTTWNWAGVIIQTKMSDHTSF